LQKGSILMNANSSKAWFGRLVLAAALGGLISMQLAAAEAAASVEAESAAPTKSVSSDLANALTGGSFNLNFRYRYEYVDQELRLTGVPFEKDANASTLRTRLVYTSGSFMDTFLTLNMDNVSVIVADDYNSTRNGNTQYPVVADPKGTDLNLASLTFTGLEDGTVVLGRQRIIRENARFIGNVVWRQNEQTYDAASIDYAVTDKLQVFYAYVSRVKRVFGPEDGIPAADFDSNSSLLDVTYTFSTALRAVGYGYWLDLENSAPFSSQTVGLRLTGSVGDKTTFSYVAEYARQEDYKNNPNSYKENYYHLVAGVDWKQFGAKAGYEVLGGSGVLGESFQTPLATLYKFNGLADQFLVTPAGGLEDASIEGTAKGWGGNYSVVYHDFSQETGGGDYGTEWDFIATWPFLEHYSVLAGFGLFDSKDGYSSDTDKVWLMLTADF
jgi:hypothetical protein